MMPFPYDTKAMSGSCGPSGGYTVPEEYVPALENKAMEAADAQPQKEGQNKKVQVSRPGVDSYDEPRPSRRMSSSNKQRTRRDRR